MHYYNYKYEEVMQMELQFYNNLCSLMYANEAREDLRMIDNTSFTNWKKDSQDKKRKTLFKLAYPEKLKPKNIIKLSDINKVLK